MDVIKIRTTEKGDQLFDITSDVVTVMRNSMKSMDIRARHAYVLLDQCARERYDRVNLDIGRYRHWSLANEEGELEGKLTLHGDCYDHEHGSIDRDFEISVEDFTHDFDIWRATMQILMDDMRNKRKARIGAKNKKKIESLARDKLAIERSMKKLQKEVGNG